MQSDRINLWKRALGLVRPALKGGDVEKWASEVTGGSSKSAKRWVTGLGAPMRKHGRADTLARAVGDVLDCKWANEEDLFAYIRAQSPQVVSRLNDDDVLVALEDLGSRLRMLIVGRWPDKLHEPGKTVEQVEKLLTPSVQAVTYLYPLVPELGTSAGKKFGEHVDGLHAAIQDQDPTRPVHGYAYDPRQCEFHTAFNVVLVFRSIDDASKVAAFAASSDSTKRCYWLGLPQRIAERLCDSAIQGLVPVIDPEWIDDELLPERSQPTEATFEQHAKVRNLLRGDSARWPETLLIDVIRDCKAVSKERGYVSVLEFGPGDYKSSQLEIYARIDGVAGGGCTVTGVDVMPRHGTFAAQANATHVQGELENLVLPCAFGSQDLVVALHSLYGVGPSQLARLVAYVRPGGYLIATMTTRESFIYGLLLDWLEGKGHGLRHRFAEDVEEWLRNSVLTASEGDLEFPRFESNVSAAALKDAALDLARVLLPVEETPSDAAIEDLAQRVEAFAEGKRTLAHETMLLIWKRPGLVSRRESEEGSSDLSWNDVYKADPVVRPRRAVKRGQRATPARSTKRRPLGEPGEKNSPQI